MRNHPINKAEEQARSELVSLVEAMLAGRQSFLEGAPQVLALQRLVGGVSDGDPDFAVFALIGSETDSLPLERVRHLWSQNALDRLAPEIEAANTWARPIAETACKRLIERFAPSNSLKVESTVGPRQ